MPGTRGVKRTSSRVLATPPPVVKKRKASESSHASNEPDVPEPIEEKANWSERWGDKKGTVLVAGQNEVGQLGLGEDIVVRQKFVPLNELGPKIVAIAAGGMHSAALDEDGAVWTFGCNDEGALGRITNGQEEESAPAKVVLPGKCVAISAGDSHSAALLDNGKLMAWGAFRDSHGCMGLRTMLKTDSTGYKCDTPEDLQIPQGVIEVASGADHLIVLTNKRKIFSLGCAEQGQLGRVPARSASRNARNRLYQLLNPTLVPIPKGDQRSGVRSRSKTPLAGAGATSSAHNSSIRQSVEDQRQITIWAGSHSSFLRTADGTIFAWGLNNYSQLGIPVKESETVMYMAKPSPGFNEPPLELVMENGELTSRPMAETVQWTQIACGLHHTVALDSEGRVYSLGRREYGRLGLGEAGDATRPTLVTALKGTRCIGVAASTCTSFAISQEGGVYSWGMGNGYALGTGEEDDEMEPRRVFSRNLTAATRALRVSAGGQHSLLLMQGSPATQAAEAQRQIPPKPDTTTQIPVIAESNAPVTDADADVEMNSNAVTVNEIETGVNVTERDESTQNTNDVSPQTGVNVMECDESVQSTNDASPETGVNVTDAEKSTQVNTNDVSPEMGVSAADSDKPVQNTNDVSSETGVNVTDGNESIQNTNDASPQAGVNENVTSGDKLIQQNTNDASPQTGVNVTDGDKLIQQNTNDAGPQKGVNVTDGDKSIQQNTNDVCPPPIPMET